MDEAALSDVLLDYARDKIVVLDSDGRFTYANDAVRHILGFEPEELIGENAFEFVHPEDADALRRGFEETIAAESYTETTVEYRHRTADGSWVWLESRMSNLTDRDLDGYVVSSRDVTDRIEAEREQQELAERLEALAAASDDVLWMFNGDWTELLFVNHAYGNIYGGSIEELRADPRAFLECIHPDDVSAVEAAMDRLSSGASVDIEYRVNPGEGYNRWVWVRAQPIVRDGDVVRITGFSRDVSDRRRRERQLSVMDNLLRHNLRNDLNIVLGATELIADRAPEVDDLVASIRRTCEDLLASAEKEREIITVITGNATRDQFDLVPTVRRSVDTVRERFPDVRIDTSLPEAASVCALEEFEPVVTELLENSIRHSESDQPRVSVSVTVDSKTVALTVADPGPSIPAIEADVLRGQHDTSDVYHSSGLGFWLVYWTVELSGGDVTVETTDRDGNRITLWLPRQPTSTVR